LKRNKSGSPKVKADKKPSLFSRFYKAAHSLRFTVWIYFAIFITSILVLIWVSFVLSLEATYRFQKTADIVDIANNIYSRWEEGFVSSAELGRLAYDNDMCVTIQDRYGLTIYSYDASGDSCYIHDKTTTSTKLAEFRALADEAENGCYYTEVESPNYGTNTILFIVRIGSDDKSLAYLFLNSSLEPLESTINIIKVQMLQVGLLMLVLGFGISIFLSKLISSPIIRITKSAEKLAQGDYNVNFNGRGYTETEKLADTLNYASGEITKVDTMRRDLMANISHDLRTPLTMVKAYAEMVRDLSGDDPEKRNEHLGIIIKESDRLTALVNDIMDLTKLENSANKLSLEVFCVNDRISDIMQRYRFLSERDGYHFYVSTGPEMYSRADVIKFDQVIYNLVNNAVNYSSESKSIYVMAVKTEDGKSIRVSITDNGKGIKEELMPLIFDRYYRAEKHKREVVGTGLGLSIVKQIFIAHGFQFGVQSELGVGSSFWFEMPLVKTEDGKQV